MGLINPAPGVVDFDGFRALQPLYEAATAAGIWVVLRPGPVSIFLLLQVVLTNPSSVHQCRDHRWWYCSLDDVRSRWLPSHQRL